MKMLLPVIALIAFCCSAVLVPAALSPAQAEARILELQRQVAHHDELYFNKAAPEISDAEYDGLKRELAALRERFPEIAEKLAIPAKDLGDDRSGRFPVAAHLEPVLGLEKCYSESDLRKFLTRMGRAAGSQTVSYVIEPKYDGLSISVTYERGRLVRAVTRGNGLEGDDVTANLRSCSDVPLSLRADSANPWPDLIELRGEVFLTQAEFDRINALRAANGQEIFAHPRNLAVGTLKSLDAAERNSRRLSVVFYGWGACQPVQVAPKSQMELLANLRAWGAPGPAVAHEAKGADEVWRAVCAIDEARPSLGFPIDGAVVKVNPLELRNKLGASRTAPLWAIAYKFEPERVETRLNAITWQVGRTGMLTPVAELEPVQIGGTTVARATLHNRREIERRDYRVGDIVRVEKAGEIVPALVGVNLSKRKADVVAYQFPQKCPSCATTLVEEGIAAVRCANRDCPAQRKRRIEHFVGNTALDLRGFGPGVVGALVDNGAVRDVDDLYRLPFVELVSAVSGKQKTAERLAAEIERSRRAELWRFIHGLSLAEVGAMNARKLSVHFKGLAGLRDATLRELVDAGLTGAAAGALSADLARPETRAAFDRLIATGVTPRL